MKTKILFLLATVFFLLQVRVYAGNELCVYSPDDDFVPVKNIRVIMKSPVFAGSMLTLSGTVVPVNATNKTIVWSIQDAGTTGAKLKNNTLKTAAAGTVTVLATIVNGASATTNYTQTFSIKVAPTVVPIFPFAGGNGTSTNPYLVSNTAQLNAVRNYFSAHFRQTANITLSGTWTPIGTEIDCFTGTYDGAGYSISNLSIPSATAESYPSLFGWIETGGAIKNVALINVNINSANNNSINYTGGIAGISFGTIENCYVTGKIRGARHVGGIAGRNDGEIKNCYTTCDSIWTTLCAGGIAGYNLGTVQYCYATGTVIGTYYTGGIVGNNVSIGAVDHCVALNKEITLIEITGYLGRVTGTNAGTLASNFARRDGMTLKGGYSVIPISSNASGLHGQDVTADLTHGDSSDVWWTDSNNAPQFPSASWSTAKNRLPHLKTTTGASFNQKQTPTVVPISPFAGGSGTSTNPYLVSNAEQLNAVRNYLVAHFRQTANITLSETWTPIGKSEARYLFAGTYDGAGYSISNLSIPSATANSYPSLFGWIGAGGAVRNVALKNVNINSTNNSSIDYTGGIASISYGTIENCYVTGTVNGSRYVGDIAGRNNGVIKNCYTTCNATQAPFFRGGITGENLGTVQYCYATGTVNGNMVAGGIVGNNGGSGAVNHCVALNKEVSIIEVTGGLGRVAGANAGTLASNYARATGMTLTGGYITLPLHSNASGLHGQDAAADLTHGSSSGAWWISAREVSFPSASWSTANNRLPHLKTTTGASFNQTQTPTVQ